MSRTVCASICAALVVLILPGRTEAAIVQCFDSSAPACRTIGFFSWTLGSLDDDVFTVHNVSDSSDLPPGGGTFEDISLIVDGNRWLLDSLAAGGQTDSQGIDFFFGVTSARIEFTYFSAPFALELSGVDMIPLLAESVVPEPSALLLLGAGLAATHAVRRRRR